MIDTSPSASQSGAFPPRPITIHQGDRCSITFDGFGLVEVTGPRRADLAGMVSALPMVLKALASVTTALRTGSAMPDLYELESVLAEAGIVPGRIAASTLEDAVTDTASSQNDRFAGLLAAVALKLDALLKDRANFRTPRAMKDGLAEAIRSIRETLAETGYGALIADLTTSTDTAEPAA
jgi:hypothetical protein